MEANNTEQSNKEKMSKEERKVWLRSFFDDLRNRFSLREGSAPESEVINAISDGIPFRGANMWILVFATMVASLGLNVNSTAVIIGAMLISPLMGPIMGFGLSVGIYDFNLMKTSLRNFGYMVATAIVAATLFFIITPISQAQSELLARTQPTIYDVMIAFFGGAAGVVAYTRKDRTFTVISGVAIATALMPPLCTAGFGIATMQWKFFGGALYLFLINAIFIALATYVIIRALKYKKKTFVEPKTERRVKRIMWCVIVITMLPSIFIAFRLINKSVFENNVDRFVATEFQFEDTRVLEKESTYYLNSNKKHRTVSLMLYGEPLSENVIESIRKKMGLYDLTNTDLIIKQSSGNTQIDFTPLQMGYAQVLDEKNRQISDLRKQISRAAAADSTATREMVLEFGAIIGNAEQVSLSRQLVYSPQGNITDTMFVCILKPTAEITPDDRVRLERWLRVKGGTEKVKIYVEQ